jgi:putative phage-type endonuclease
MITGMEWHQWRKKGIGSSEAAICMGISKRRTVEDLIIEKLSPVVIGPTPFPAQCGIDAEPKIRSLFEMLYDREFPPGLVEMYGEPCMASLDGWDKEAREIIEIKFSGKQDYGIAKTGNLPPAYMAQVQHALMVTSCVKCFYVTYPWSKNPKSEVFTSDKLIVIVVKPDIVYQEKILGVERKVWAEIERRRKLI